MFNWRHLSLDKSWVGRQWVIIIPRAGPSSATQPQAVKILAVRMELQLGAPPAANATWSNSTLSPNLFPIL